jgi:hypothetical protein
VSDPAIRPHGRFQAGAIDEKMQWLFMTNRRRQDGQTATTAAQRCVIRDSDIELERISDRSQQAFGLTQRLVEHQAKRETGLDGCRRIDWLAAPLYAGARPTVGLRPPSGRPQPVKIGDPHSGQRFPLNWLTATASVAECFQLSLNSTADFGIPTSTEKAVPVCF